jgi:hypothetical protein
MKQRGALRAMSDRFPFIEINKPMGATFRPSTDAKTPKPRLGARQSNTRLTQGPESCSHDWVAKSITSINRPPVGA